MLLLGVLQAQKSAVPLTVDYLVIAGGGGCEKADSGDRSFGAGGGGAGGYRCSVTGENSGGGASAESVLTLEKATNYTVTVGAGGPIVTAGVTGNGSNSVFSSITSTGGGGGALGANTGQTGGSGGGGSFGSAGGSGTANQGFNGGNSGSSTGFTNGAGGGGGGAGSAGGNGGDFEGAAGTAGSGVSSSITSTSVTRAVGGAGGPSNADLDGANGAANTGNGATAPGVLNGGSFAGKTGGSGGVIIKYPDTYTITVGAGLTANTPPAAGGFKITTFTAGDDDISFS